MLLAAMPASHAAASVRVDVYDPATGKGYQRVGIASRMRAIARYYRDGGRMPNPLLINIRADDLNRVRVIVTDGDQGDYDAAIELGMDWIGAGSIDLPEDLIVWVFDGQHRVGGLAELVALVKDFDSFPVPLSVTIGLTEDGEMEEFYEVNHNAKSVTTDLALEILRQRALRDPDLASKLIGSGKDWQTKGLEVVRILDATEGPWHDRIQAPNERKHKSDSLTMAQAQFVLSLKPVLDMALFKSAEPATIAQVLNAYWKGIALVLPEPFTSDPLNSPKDWVIQKGPGVFTLHRAMPMVVEVMRARGERLGVPEAYAQVLQGLTDLSGEVTDPDTQQRVPVSGAEFWRAGSRGVAGAYTGEAGRRHLFLMIQALLPKPAEEIAL